MKNNGFILAFRPDVSAQLNQLTGQHHQWLVLAQQQPQALNIKLHFIQHLLWQLCDFGWAAAFFIPRYRLLQSGGSRRQ